MSKLGTRAFSLIEFAVTMVIIGLMTGLAIKGLSSSYVTSQISDTRQKIEALKIALENYRTQYGNYPCPSPISAPSNNASYGVAETNCFSTCPAGLTCQANSTNGSLNDVVVGSVPYTTLGISAELSIDSWGRKIDYVVDARFTQDENRCETDGFINVTDYNGNTVTTAAAYAFISHGQDKKGAYSPDAGTISTACDAGAKDGPNCNGGFNFVQSDIITGTAAAQSYDDILGFGLNQNTVYCPAGLTGCAVWYDASDWCTIIPNTGGVQGLRSKTANSSLYTALQGSSGQRPSQSTSKINNRYYITFNQASTPALYATTWGSLFVGPYSIVTVFSTTASTTTFNTVAFTATYNSPSYDRGHGLTTNFFRSNNQTAGGMQNITSTATFNDGYPHIAITTVGPTGGSNTYVDNNLIGNQNGTASIDVLNTILTLGSHTSLGKADYNLMEYIYFNQELTSNQLQTLNTYLAKKWGTR